MKGRSGNGLLRCPTRPGGLPKALISQLITRELCHQRQRESYHKCPTCVNSTLWQKGKTPGVSRHPVPLLILSHRCDEPVRPAAGEDLGDLEEIGPRSSYRVIRKGVSAEG